MQSEYVYFAVRRGGKWVAKRVEDATEEDLKGVQLTRDFMTAVTSKADLDAAVIQIESNVRTGEDPFDGLRHEGESSAGLDLLRRIVREAGFRTTIV